MRNKVLVLFLILCLGSFASSAKNDSIIVQTSQYLLGEIKSMERSILTIKTKYGKSDFRVKFKEVQGLFSESSFIVSTTSIVRIYGKISSPVAGYLTITTLQNKQYTFPLGEIIFIKSIEDGFLDRLSAGIDLGLTLTRARNQRQFSTRSRFNYMTERWSFDGAFNKLVTRQEDIEAISRGDGNLTAIYFTKKKWFTVGRMEYLYNTEQALDLRLNTMVGFGKDFVNSNAFYWRLFGGLAYNDENYAGETMDKTSGEAWVASELNLFDVKDISILSNIFVYPSLTESDRIRVDYRLDLTYNLPLDFYIKTGITVNYDNQPFLNSRSLDYILQTTFGWSW